MKALSSHHFAAGNPGLDEMSVGELERGLGAPLPEAARVMYRRLGGTSSRIPTALPMRLMPPEDVLETMRQLAASAETYQPHPQARYLFTDDESNWAGIFVEGPLRGKLTILDHDICSPAPRFADLESFLEKLVSAADAGLDWCDMTTDYPLGPESARVLIDEARETSALFEGIYESSEDAMVRDTAAVIALHLSSPFEGDSVEKMLSSPLPGVRQVAFRVAAAHRRPEWRNELVKHARAAIARGDHTTWRNALVALAPIDDGAEVAALIADAPRNWPSPIRHRS